MTDEQLWARLDELEGEGEGKEAWLDREGSNAEEGGEDDTVAKAQSRMWLPEDEDQHEPFGSGGGREGGGGREKEGGGKRDQSVPFRITVKHSVRTEQSSDVVSQSCGIRGQSRGTFQSLLLK